MLFAKFLLTALTVILYNSAWAMDMPRELRGQTVTIVVPYAAGGNGDFWFRLLARQVTTNTGLTLVVINKPGAQGNIGANDVAMARPDGMTLLGTDSTTLVLNPLMNVKGCNCQSGHCQWHLCRS